MWHVTSIFVLSATALDLLLRARSAAEVPAPPKPWLCSVNGMMCARLYTKGAAELLLQQCSLRLVAGAGAERLSQPEKDDLLHSFAADGNR